jgi:two-component sensor histidine kinase
VYAGAPFAQMFALVLHELATNAAKYGSLSQPRGSVAISWSIENGSGEPQLTFSWVEQGGPPVSAPTHQGFGSRLIAAALSGTPRITYESSGFTYTIDVPLADVSRSSKPMMSADDAK